MDEFTDMRGKEIAPRDSQQIAGKVSSPTAQSSSALRVPRSHVVAQAVVSETNTFGPIETHNGPHAPTISAVLNTLNEERNIGNAIRSIRSWVTEVIVMDMHSDDATAEIARSLGAKVFSYPRVINFDAARAAAVELATSDWVLLLDADEVITYELSRELLRLTQEDCADAYMIPRLNHFLGTPLLHGGLGPEQDRQLRFYRRGSVSLNDILHQHIQANPGTRVANVKYHPDACIVHFCYKDATAFVSKLNKYTSLTAFQRKDSKRLEDRSLILISIREFLFRYIWLKGFRDGWKGFYWSFMMAVYRMTQNVKVREFQSGGDKNDPYQRIAQQVLSRYESECTKTPAQRNTVCEGPE